MLDASDARIAEIVSLGGGEVSRDDVRGFLKAEEDEGWILVDGRTMAQFLDGVILALRGRAEARPQPPIDPRITNNDVLKKLRVAFELKDADMLAVFAAAGCEVTKPELSAFFRKRDNSHYRPCGDQYLRYFLRGLAKRVRP
jgi:uncharacterized protein YehS (DUF1456 family)